MYTIKKNYRNETKEILKLLNEEFYNYEEVDIDLRDFKLSLNDNKGTEVDIVHFKTIEELIHANLGSVKIFKYFVSGERL